MTVRPPLYDDWETELSQLRHLYHVSDEMNRAIHSLLRSSVHNLERCVKLAVASRNQGGTPAMEFSHFAEKQAIDTLTSGAPATTATRSTKPKDDLTAFGARLRVRRRAKGSRKSTRKAVKGARSKTRSRPPSYWDENNIAKRIARKK